MQRDKAALDYHGLTQLEWLMSLLAPPELERAFVSVREHAQLVGVHARFACVRDSAEQVGPLAGILAAQAAYPHAAWLVLACDLPFFDRNALRRLINARATDCDATAYRAPASDLPEPLCAIYEPSSRAALAAQAAKGNYSPQAFLRSARSAYITAEAAQTLANVNTPTQHQAALAELRAVHARVR
jgi:molybdopterin-guanine dinucleotide biosynthesis protein A